MSVALSASPNWLNKGIKRQRPRKHQDSLRINLLCGQFAPVSVREVSSVSHGQDRLHKLHVLKGWEGTEVGLINEEFVGGEGQGSRPHTGL